MVRQKNRWLLVQFDYEPNILSQCLPKDSSSTATATPKNKKRKLNESNSQESTSTNDETIQISQITSTDIYRALQETLSQNYGIVASSTTGVSVRLYDPKIRLAVIKTSRDNYPMVRSALVFLTKVKQIKVVASTISVNGSARTARNAAWKELQRRFFSKETAIEYGLVFGDIGRNPGKDRDAMVKKARAAAKKALAELEERMEKIGSSC